MRNSIFCISVVLCAICMMVNEPSEGGWTAYNDCVYQSGHAANAANVTTYCIGSGSPGPSYGFLKDFATGTSLPVAVILTQQGGVVWQPDVTSGGSDCAPGTDARNTFGGIAGMQGVIYYGSSGWYVNLSITGLNPAAVYEFATSANRNNPGYTTRISIFSIIGADAYTNASTTGVTVLSPDSVQFCTGDNTATGYVARWTGIKCGTDGSFSVRVTHSASGSNAYAFDVFMLKETAGGGPFNLVPVVNAGADQSIIVANAATLSGTATDDGLPEPPALTTQWSRKSGPGTVSFANASALQTTATFSAPGSYVLTLTASDGLLQASDDVAITVDPKWLLTGDANRDRVVNVLDLIFIRNRLNLSVIDGSNWQADLNEDGRINILDLIFARNNLGTQSKLATIDNPYKDVNWATFGRHKGNFHTHTTQSDGSMSPGTVIDQYKQLGYSVLALTDHNTVTYPWATYGRDPVQLGMVDVQGNELSNGHHTAASSPATPAARQMKTCC